MLRCTSKGKTNKTKSYGIFCLAFRTLPFLLNIQKSYMSLWIWCSSLTGWCWCRSASCTRTWNNSILDRWCCYTCYFTTWKLEKIQTHTRTHTQTHKFVKTTLQETIEADLFITFFMQCTAMEITFGCTWASSSTWRVHMMRTLGRMNVNRIKWTTLFRQSIA